MSSDVVDLQAPAFVHLADEQLGTKEKAWYREAASGRAMLWKEARQGTGEH